MKRILIGFLSVILISCGGSDDDNPIDVAALPTAVKGTAAVGAAVQATITVKSSNGEERTTTSNSEGFYALDMSTLPGPFIIKVVPNDSSIDTMYSYSAGSGVANATQFTTLVLFIAKDTDLSTVYDDWETVASTWSLTDVESAAAVLNANFETELSDLGLNPNTLDMFSTEFTANGEGLDAFLDEYSVSIDYLGGYLSDSRQHGWCCCYKRVNRYQQLPYRRLVPGGFGN